jgi:predicted neuraminidase
MTAPMSRIITGGVAMLAVVALDASQPIAQADGTAKIVSSEFIYERAPFPEAHASTIVETPAGLLAAWFGGTEEKNPDVGIWVSRRDGGRWSEPVEVATGVQADGTRRPTWNPVLFQMPGGPLLLFYKVGPSPRDWWGLYRTSGDSGRTWSEAVRLPNGILGPIRAKPILLSDGTLLAGSSTEHDGWVVHMERLVLSKNSGSGGDSAPAVTIAASKTGPLNDPKVFGAIQPTILAHSATRLQILCRSRQKAITEAWSDDSGRTWSAMTATPLPNPSAGIDAVRLEDGRFLLVYNPTTSGRQKLEVAVSKDGKAWRTAVVLEDSPGEYSYPAMIQAKNGRVHVTYTWKRERVKHVVIAP